MTQARGAIDAVLARAAEALSARDEPGPREIGAAIAALPEASRDCPPTLAPACAHLDAALALGTAATRPLIDAVAAARPYLAWKMMGREGFDDALREQLAYVEIVGPEGAVVAPDLRVGLYIQAPGVDYPSHAHDAEELYLVLAGTARWQRGWNGSDDPFATVPPGEIRHHRAKEPHAMITGEQPLLALWTWRGAIGGRYWFV